MKDEDIDTAIERYRAELAAEADLARADLDELEDHLRTLVRDLRSRGVPAAEAVTLAARRLGEPAQLAREHTRVRPAFGARLSRGRAWSVAALLVMCLLSVTYYEVIPMGLWSRAGLDLAFGVVLLGALVLRISWVRPILLGGLAFFLIPQLVTYALYPTMSPLFLVINAGLVVFLVPWRRGEMSAAGAALALQVWAYGAASFAQLFGVTMRDGSYDLVAPTAQIAFGMAVVATIGGILRARWSALAAAISSVTLAIAVTRLWDLEFRFEYAGVHRVMTLCLVGSGAVAAAVSAVLSWRTARSTLGTLRGIAS